MFAYEAHARLLLCRAAQSGERGQRDDIRHELTVHRKALAKAQRRDAHAELERIEGRTALLHGDQAAALRWFSASSAGFDAYGARDQAARDRYVLGVLTGGDQGQKLSQEALALLEELGVVSPLQHVQRYFPELSEIRNDIRPNQAGVGDSSPLGQ